jgi:DNA-binding MarR family transcriptional regulator
MGPDAHLVFRRYLDAVGLNGQASAAAAGLHATEWYALSVLDLAGRLTSGELAERTGLTTGATTRLIDRLERGGHVRRVADPTDRRKVIIEPTGQASPDIEEIVGPARRLLADVFNRYTQEQLGTLFDYFAHATPALQQATEEIRGRTTGGSDRHRPKT